MAALLRAGEILEKRSATAMAEMLDEVEARLEELRLLVVGVNRVGIAPDVRLREIAEGDTTRIKVGLAPFLGALRGRAPGAQRPHLEPRDARPGAAALSRFAARGGLRQPPRRAKLSLVDTVSSGSMHFDPRSVAARDCDH
jgi:hypothetical protein